MVSEVVETIILDNFYNTPCTSKTCELLGGASIMLDNFYNTPCTSKTCDVLGGALVMLDNSIIVLVPADQWFRLP